MTALAPAEPAQAAPTTQAEEATDAAESPLEGFRIGVTSDRRSRDLIEALERRGAEVLHAPALKIAPVQEDMRLIEDTRAIIAAKPDLCIATTAYGMRRWCEAADSFGIGDELLETLGNCRMFVRGPKARGAVRAAGLADVGISSDETTATLVDMLLTEGVRGKTVAMQLHGYTDVRQIERLRMSGATVLTVTPYRWVKPDGEDRLPRLIEAACSGNLDVLTFTSAPAVDAMWSTAHEMGLYKQLVESLKLNVTTAVVGPVTAQPLLDAGVTPLIPERFRMGALIRLVCEHLALNHVRRLDTRSGNIELRGRSLRIDGQAVELAPAPLLLLRALLGAGGAVLSRESLSDLLELRGSVHALDMTVSRLRSSLPDGKLIETVVKRGYRIRV
ncbi:uroporphyrinogen-III synthase [Arthrobacter sp. FX8]|jgi:uroporphyrinogen-III synthase|uniref:uroporphyrinogen-III synthase n=1 Tax=Micrococcaceae TaxID=1268 RepID=UPI00036FA8A5|nr:MULTISPECIES: uroporphyrinogen-III synthase [unclassified Arthrobacter]KRE66026.1 uroporphyrinogen III synthetase [Arthrobacter sp. Soil761]TWD53816.1 uroporphyrinogen-III synthase [Arthrobacter sp. AG367]WAJ34009.1 uroporphyrinogen-III synthase [Arthrobacter sp. FX8]BCW53905.1 uroporphyrinogen-III synthase [Arthrobacter sp. StoSoilB19]